MKQADDLPESTSRIVLGRGAHFQSLNEERGYVFVRYAFVGYAFVGYAFVRYALQEFIKGIHNTQRIIDGISWVDPDQKNSTGKPLIVTLHGCARATFNTWAKDARGYGHKAFPRDLRKSSWIIEVRATSVRMIENRLWGICERCLMLWGGFVQGKLGDLSSY